MLLNSDGSFTRDIDIDELKVSYGDHIIKSIVLERNKITLYNTTHPIDNTLITQDSFDKKEFNVSFEQFYDLSDQIHNAGLLDLIQPLTDKDVCSGGSYQSMYCVFNDGAQYEYRINEKPSKQFIGILEILLDFCATEESKITRK